MSSLLRRILLADAGLCAVFAIVLIAGASLFSAWFGLSVSFVRNVGLLLIPVTLLLLWVARQGRLVKPLVWTVILLNGLWTVASIVILLLGWITPNVLGTVFVIAQAILVGIFAEAEYLTMRRTEIASVQ